MKTGTDFSQVSARYMQLQPDSSDFVFTVHVNLAQISNGLICRLHTPLQWRQNHQYNLPLNTNYHPFSENYQMTPIEKQEMGSI